MGNLDPRIREAYPLPPRRSTLLFPPSSHPDPLRFSSIRPHMDEERGGSYSGGRKERSLTREFLSFPFHSLSKFRERKEEILPAPSISLVSFRIEPRLDTKQIQRTSTTRCGERVSSTEMESVGTTRDACFVLSNRSTRGSSSSCVGRYVRWYVDLVRFLFLAMREQAFVRSPHGSIPRPVSFRVVVKKRLEGTIPFASSCFSRARTRNRMHRFRTTTYPFHFSSKARRTKWSSCFPSIANASIETCGKKNVVGNET